MVTGLATALMDSCQVRGQGQVARPAIGKRQPFRKPTCSASPSRLRSTTSWLRARKT